MMGYKALKQNKQLTECYLGCINRVLDWKDTLITIHSKSFLMNHQKKETRHGSIATHHFLQLRILCVRSKTLQSQNPDFSKTQKITEVSKGLKNQMRTESTDTKRQLR